jgi:hypothetical protein
VGLFVELIYGFTVTPGNKKSNCEVPSVLVSGILFSYYSVVALNLIVDLWSRNVM